MEAKRSFFDSVAFFIIQAVLFLTPIFFIPAASVPFDVAKASLIILGSVLALIAYVIGRIRAGSFSFPKTWGYGSVLILLATYLLAALFSANPGVSLFGQNLDIGTFAFVASLVVLFLLIPIFFDSEEKVFYAYVSLFVSFFIVAVYQTLHLFFPNALALNVFTSPTTTLLGSWNDLGVFFGLSTILSVFTLETTKLTKLSRTLLYICFAISLIFLAIVNFSPVWYVVAFFALVSFIYQLSFKKHTEGKRFPVHSLIVLVISVAFVFFGGTFGTWISNITQISQIEVRPSTAATFDIAGATLAQHPIFGVGPDRFTSEWLMHKPAGINSTIFWNVDFNYGIGYAPSLLVTIGIVGMLGLLAFLVLFLIRGVRGLFAETKGHFGSYLVISSFVAAVYLWVFAFLYVPSGAILALTFIWSGLFLATLVAEGAVHVRTIAFLDKPVKNFVSVLVGVLIVIAAVAFGYYASTRALADVYYQSASIELSNTSNLAGGEAKLAKAFTLAPNALYSRAIADVYLADMSNLLNSTSTDQTTAQSEFQSYLSTAIQAAQESVTLDPTDYQNYLELAKVYGSVVSLKITGAYDASKGAFQSALALNPQDPEIYYDLAQLDLANGDNASAETDIQNALNEKSDYADAIYLLSQIDIQENKIPEATQAIEAVAELSPSNAGIFFELGLLQYDQQDYKDAQAAFKQALTLSPDYANAQYFLGLTDYYLNDPIDATTLFTALAKSNPDNTDVTSILANLEAGKPPFGVAKTTAPKTLPVSQ